MDAKCSVKCGTRGTSTSRTDDQCETGYVEEFDILSESGPPSLGENAAARTDHDRVGAVLSFFARSKTLECRTQSLNSLLVTRLPRKPERREW